MDKLYNQDYAYWAEEMAAKLQEGKKKNRKFINKIIRTFA